MCKGHLDKKRKKVKRIWWEKCELQLSHEDVIDIKDKEIVQLKACLLTVTLALCKAPEILVPEWKDLAQYH